MQVKICGLTNQEAALAAVAAGADMLGFIFAPSRRRLSPGQARSIIATLRATHGPSLAARMVGVFVDECPLRVDDIAAYCGLDYVQLNGGEDAAYLRRLATPAIVARPAVADLTAESLAPLRGLAALFLLDNMTPTARGGTGTTCDWQVAAALARQHPLLLAGGLTPANVGAAIAATQPWGVDVSSGVETDGRKDPAKMAAFVRQARLAAPHPVLPGGQKGEFAVAG